MTPGRIFAVAWGFGFAGAVLVYWSARRYGRAFLDTRYGRRLVTPAAYASMEREYLRFGLLGIFVTRLLPGFRSFVAPFAGLINLSPARALTPIALASGLWYAALTLVGTTVGSEWEAIQGVLGRLNRGLAITAGLLLAALVLGFFLRRRRREREELWDAIHLAFQDEGTDLDLKVTEDPSLAGAAALLVELARADEGISEDDLTAIRERVRERWGFVPRELPRPSRSGGVHSPAERAAVSRVLVSRYGPRVRLRLAARLWRLVAGAESGFAPHEDRVMRRVADLLGLSTEELDQAREGSGPR